MRHALPAARETLRGCEKVMVPHADDRGLRCWGICTPRTKILSRSA